METNKKSFVKRGKKIIKIANGLVNKIKREEKTERQIIIESLQDAKQEWKDQEEYFQHVTEPELVDYAIYQIEASRLKYIYLLKKIKEIEE